MVGRRISVQLSLSLWFPPTCIPTPALLVHFLEKSVGRIMMLLASNHLISLTDSEGCRMTKLSKRFAGYSD